MSPPAIGETVASTPAGVDATEGREAMRCAEHDHSFGDYTDEQREHLHLVRAFNRDLAAAADAGRDLTQVTAALDPDPLRYMWVDEGDLRVPALLEEARRLLDAAPVLGGHRRVAGRPVTAGGWAARPSASVGPDGTTLLAWIDWEDGAGEQVMVALRDRAGGEIRPPEPVSGDGGDCFRPTALFDRHGRPWVLYARNTAGHVGVWARRWESERWTDAELVSTTPHPSFNQEAVATADGGIEACWQGRRGGRFGIFSRRWSDGLWSEADLISDDADNVWDPSLAALPGGGVAYAWSVYGGGTYRVVTRLRDPRMGPCRALTAGTDYALHPSLAATHDGRVWCAYDVVTVHGHGGSGPTALRHVDAVGQHVPAVMKEPGLFVPPELRPNITAAISIVAVDDGALRPGRGDLARGVEISPSGLPRLAATADGGLLVAYRVLRRLPLLTYYWEVAAQVLGDGGWGPLRTFEHSDGGVEEVAVTAGPGGATLAWQADGRRAVALDWTEGFGGRACLELADHLGEVAWHGMHRAGEIRTATIESRGPAAAGAAQPVAHRAARTEARTWAGGGPRTPYTTVVDGRELTLYWGDLHRHSLVSRCTAADEPSLEEFYRYSWDVCEYDFWAVTDHAENSSAYQWWSTQKIADLFRIDGRFVPLYGFEWTSNSGHQNVIYASQERGAPIFSSLAEASQRPDQLWDLLRRHPEHPAITIPHHPGSGMVPYDWSHFDPEYLRLVEIFQACRGNYEDDGCYRQYADATLPGSFVLDGLRRGYRFGLIASSDHGNGASYVGAYAPGLDRNAVFDALRSRRTIGATTRDIVLDVRVGDTFLGGERRAGGPVVVALHARGYRDLARIDILRDGVVVHSVAPELDLPQGWISVPVRVEWGRNAAATDWSGTLRVERGEVLRTEFWAPEVCGIGPAEVRWTAATQSFGGGGIYGPTRGGIELSVVGPPDAVVHVETGAGRVSADLATLRDGPVDATATTMSARRQPGGRLRLQPGIGGLSSLGAKARTLEWTDPTAGPGWYYVRAFLIDGEMAWSSPIWVDPPETPPDPLERERPP
jgi:hypothetical protein